MERIEIKEGKERLRLDLKGSTFVHMTDAAGKRVATVRGDQPNVALNLPPGEYFLETDGAVTKTVTEASLAASPGRLVLRCTAAEYHPVDGIPLIPADGHSFLLIDVHKVNHEGTAVKRKADSETIWLRSTGGVVQDADGKGPIRQINLVNGAARFRLVSEPFRRCVTVETLTTQLGLLGDRITVEFV